MSTDMEVMIARQIIRNGLLQYNRYLPFNSRDFQKQSVRDVLEAVQHVESRQIEVKPSTVQAALLENYATLPPNEYDVFWTEPANTLVEDIVAWKDFLLRKKLSYVVSSATNDLENPSDIRDIYANIAKRVTSLAPLTASEAVTEYDMNTYVDGVHFPSLREAYLSGTPQSSVSISYPHFPMLNGVFGNLREGKLMVIAGRPANGKSLFLRSLAIAISGYRESAFGQKFTLNETPFKSAFFSAEMSVTEFSDSLLSILSGISATRISEPHNLTNEEIVTLIRATAPKSDGTGGVRLNMVLNDTPFIALETLIEKSHEYVSNGANCIIIDHLQRISLNKATGDPRKDTSTKIYRINQMADTLKVPVIIASQINREGENGKLTQAMLAESGATEQEADFVLGISLDKDTGVTRCTVLKNRNAMENAVILVQGVDRTPFLKEIGLDRSK